jgi:hypothetical protein
MFLSTSPTSTCHFTIDTPENCAALLRHGRDVHPAWVNVVTAALALKSFGGQVTRAEVMLESREGSGFETKSTKCDLDSF